MPSLALKPLATDDKTEKLRIEVKPGLGDELRAYQADYKVQYGSEVAIEALVPAILEQFLENDRAFKRWKKSQVNGAVAERAGQ